MHTSGSYSFLIFALLATALCFEKHCSAARAEEETKAKATRTRSEDLESAERNFQRRLEDAEAEEEGDKFLRDEEEEEEEETGSFRERYRRLIPYMTYYVTNNYVNPQTAYQKSRVIAPVGATSAIQQRRPQGYLGGRTTFGSQQQQQILTSIQQQQQFSNDIKKLTSNRYFVNPPVNRDKFIPSVQYDPHDMDNENFFTPVLRYNNQNLNFDEYQSALYQRFKIPTMQSHQQESKTVEDYRRILAQQQRQQQRIFATTFGPLTSTLNDFVSTPAYGDLLARKPTPSSHTMRPEFGITTKKPALESPPTFAQIPPRPFRLPEDEKPAMVVRRPAHHGNLNHIVKSLQLSNRLPEMLNAENIDESIKTLVEILSLLNGEKSAGNVQRPNYGPPKRVGAPKRRPVKPVIVQDDGPGPYHVNLIDLGGKYLTDEAPPYNVLTQSDVPATFVQSTIPTTTTNDFSYDGTTPQTPLEHFTTTNAPAVEKTQEEETGQNYPPPDGAVSHVQNFPPTSIKYGATRGKPNVDYPAHATIPKTQFNCADQRYKGFFGDPDTRCQVWHYCDLNGGMSSFLCPNGTIFSQVALTCDWWFNVKCESTTQLYVLNERLYKYILPVMPKFPEDFTGPEVDRYLELKFKEMEAKMKEKKLRKQQQRQRIQQQQQQEEDESKIMKNIQTDAE